MSDSDSSVDENIKNMLEAVDTGFLDNNLFKQTTEDRTAEPAIPKRPKSQRYLEIEEEVHSSDLKVSESMQKFIAKKLSEAIEKKYKFVDASQLDEKCSNLKMKPPKARIKLLRGFDVPIRDLDGSLYDELLRKRSRPEIRKRDPEPDDLKESEKVESAVLDSELIESRKEIQAWANRSRPDKLFRYKCGKDGTLHFVDPTNEFSILRKKNCWSEKMISNEFKKTKRKGGKSK